MSRVWSRGLSTGPTTARGGAGEGGQRPQHGLGRHDSEEKLCGQVSESHIRENRKRWQWGLSSHGGVLGALKSPTFHQVREYDHGGVGQGLQSRILRLAKRVTIREELGEEEMAAERVWHRTPHLH